MTLVLIWAMGENRVIGRDGGLPWHLPDDLAHFKERTLGHPVVMGRRTFESVGKPLPGRTNVVVTRDPKWHAPGVRVAHSLEEALERTAGEREVYVAGGAEVYRRALPLADRLDLTLVHAAVEGDTFFPEVDWTRWRLVSEERHAADARHEHAFTFRVYERA